METKNMTDKEREESNVRHGEAECPHQNYTEFLPRELRFKYI